MYIYIYILYILSIPAPCQQESNVTSPSARHRDGLFSRHLRSTTPPGRSIHWSLTGSATGSGTPGKKNHHGLIT